MENFALLIMPYVVIYVLYIHNPEGTRKILRTSFKKGNGKLGNPTMEVARLVNHAKGKKLDTHATYIVNSHKRMVSVLFYVIKPVYCFSMFWHWM